MKTKKDYHLDPKLEKNLVLEDLELLKLDRKGKEEKKSEKMSLRERFLINL